MKQTGSRAARLAPPALLAVLALIRFLPYRAFEPDDLYIYLQFVRNLLGRGELASNAGESTCGFTSALWLFILSGVTALTHDPFLAAKIASGLAWSAGLVGLYSVRGVTVYTRYLFMVLPFVILGEWLRDHAQSAAVVAALDIGAIGYISGRRILDMNGLVSADPETLLKHPPALTLRLLQSRPFDNMFLFQKEPLYYSLYAVEGGAGRGPG